MNWLNAPDANFPPDPRVAGMTRSQTGVIGNDLRAESGAVNERLSVWTRVAHSGAGGDY